MANEIYSVVGDFTVAGVLSTQLQEEVIEEVLITTAITYILIEDDVVNIVFPSALSAPEKVALDAVVADHTPGLVTMTTSEMLPGYSLISHKEVNGAGSEFTTSMVPVTLNGMSYTFTPESVESVYRLFFNGILTNTVGNKIITICFYLDGILLESTEKGVSIPKASVPVDSTIEKWEIGLDPDVSHTIELRWETTGGTAEAVGVNRVFEISQYLAV